MRGEQLAQVSQTVGKSRASRSPQDVKTADAKPARTATPANAPSAAQRTAVKEETVAEAARENREKQASGEKPKIVIEQDSKGQIVVEDEN